MHEERWQEGLRWMDVVYGDGFSAHHGDAASAPPFLEATVERLFAEVWSRPGLSVRDRRLLVVGATAALGRPELLRVQLLGGLRRGEFDADQLQEMVLQLAYYVGWGKATLVSAAVQGALTDFADDGPTPGPASADATKSTRKDEDE
ncbi:carboxymuconolactone decarboxylase family protein [Streptomyces sp. NPDC048106]|uniref:carboxymuconolactone decarboxylase family protein n=1 Tax=Streptomyces sp. NPDC048106 TaxID=3155750 RepID=UPI00345707A2